MIVTAGDYYLVVGELNKSLIKGKVKIASDQLYSTYDDLSSVVAGLTGRRHDNTVKWNCCDDECMCPELKVPSPREAP
jgi:hypothetical protein